MKIAVLLSSDCFDRAGDRYAVLNNFQPILRGIESRWIARVDVVPKAGIAMEAGNHMRLNGQ